MRSARPGVAAGVGQEVAREVAAVETGPSSEERKAAAVSESGVESRP